MKKRSVNFLKFFTLFFLLFASFSPVMSIKSDAMSIYQCKDQSRQLQSTLWSNGNKANSIAKNLAYKGQKNWSWKDYFNVMNYVKAFENKLLSLFKKGGDCSIYGAYNQNTNTVQWR